LAAGPACSRHAEPTALVEVSLVSAKTGAAETITTTAAMKPVIMRYIIVTLS
jgi:hypothetical protein